MQEMCMQEAFFRLQIEAWSQYTQYTLLQLARMAKRASVHKTYPALSSLQQNQLAERLKQIQS